MLLSKVLLATLAYADRVELDEVEESEFRNVLIESLEI